MALISAGCMNADNAEASKFTENQNQQNQQKKGKKGESMREFKFRIWHKKSKKWVESMALLSEGILCMQNGSDIEDDGFNEKDLIIQQYTGLKDKNDREIYEGDIVITLKDNYIAREFKGNYKIGFYNHGFDLTELECGDSYWLNELDGIKLEIIGNIYDNPELLK
jgi:uncharacterized phage protein (TIGR01671 family)